MIWIFPKRLRLFSVDLIFAGKQRVGAASAGVAIKTHSAAQIVLNIVDFFMILADCKKAGRGASAPTAQPAPCAPGEKARAFITETTMKNQDLKMLMELMLRNLQANLDRITAQFEQLAKILDDSRSECVRLRAENKRLRGLLEQEHGFHRSDMQRIVACLMERKFRTIEGGKCTNTEPKFDA